MLQQISLSHASLNNSLKGTKAFSKNASNSISNMQKLNTLPKYDVAKSVNAYKAYNNIRLASSISFGSSFADAFEELNKAMVTCRDEEHGKEGEEVGSRVDVNNLTSKFIQDLTNYDDAIKTTIQVFKEKDKDTNRVKKITDARTQIKKGQNDIFKFEMTVRPPRTPNELSGQTKDIVQNIEIQLVPYRIKLDEENKRQMVGTPETAYILNTKGKLMAVIEDGENVLLTNAGKLRKKDQSDGFLGVNAAQTGNVYSPFRIPNIPEIKEKSGGSQGGGTEIVIGLENGRFVPEIIESIEEFERKVQNGEIVLDEFIPAPDIKDIQIGMLAGGFGSRAEYANASSSKIMHNKKDGSNLTKGCFRTATGLTPMETSFISLHKAGYLDCSKENFGIGKNVKFYINDSDKNGGNGSFSVDMYNTMKRNDRKSLLILPNDAMSRIPEALKRLNSKAHDGKTAMVMIAKQVKSSDAIGKLGIMKIEDDGTGVGLISQFAEKPDKIEKGFADKNDNCFANTFQFAVSEEAFDVLNMLEPYFEKKDKEEELAGKKNKESRDWSKTYTPVLMAITQNDDPVVMSNKIKEATKIDIEPNILATAKKILGNQKIYAIKSDEPWADCGTLNALYDTTMKIAHGEFSLEDFERKHVIESIDPDTGLVASTPELKAEIEKKYEISGQIMVVPKAKPVDENAVMTRNEKAITRYSSKFPKKG